MFRLIDPPHDPPEEVQERSRAFIAKVHWTYATTMPQWPHEYVVRARIARQGLADEYDRLWFAIQEFGYRGRFRREVKPYLNVDGFRYWSCLLAACAVENHNAACPHARVGVGCVMNRALLDEDVPPKQLQLEV